MLEQSWWLRNKWAVNSMNALLLIYLIYTHQWPSMQIVLASTWSLANIYAHMQFFMTVWNNFTMQHELGWIAIECHNCCMNGRNLWIIHIPSCSPILDVPTPFSNLGKSQIILLTCLFWSCSWVEMLAAKADFLTPGDPLIQITLWPPVFLTSVSIACRMSLRVPSIHNLHSLSFFPPQGTHLLCNCLFIL